MKFLNSNYGYADFGKPENRARVEAARAANRSKNVSTAVLQEPGGKLAIIPKPSNTNSRPKRQPRPLSERAAPPTRRFGFEKSARSTGAGLNQGMRDLPRNARSTGAGLNQGMKDAAYGGGQMLRKAGKFAKNNKVGVGLAAAGALGAVGYGVYRKMRSDKGKKRGNYQ